jgi:hypothetical protein
MLRPVERAPSPTVEIQRGPRAVEEALLASLAPFARSLREARGEPALLRQRLASPVRIVVPSRSLREHVAARLVRESGGAAAGVLVQTLRGLAREVLERAEVPIPGADSLIRLLVRREARREPALSGALEDLRDGYAAASASVDDLLDAGFEAAHAAALLEALAESEAPAALRVRAAALVRVAARTARSVEGLGLCHRASAYARAADLLADRPELLPARAVCVHGFADVTGAAGSLLEALVRTCAARVFLDHPPDPADPLRRDSAAEFTEPLRARLAHWAPKASEPDTAALPVELTLLEAPGAEAEARGVAERVRGRLDAGAAPERIGIVVRDLALYAVPLRRHLGRLAVPFSGATGAALLSKPGARVLHSLLELLRGGASAPVDRWLAARAGGKGATRSETIDLRVAFHSLGAGRLGEAAALDVAERLAGRSYLALPVRQGLRSATEGESEEDGKERRRTGASLKRRSVSAERLAAAVSEAAELVGLLEAWSGRASFTVRRERLEALTGRAGLRWRPASAAQVALSKAQGALAAEVPEDLELDGGETVLLLERALRGAEMEGVGGSGGGVAVLSVTEARAHTFEHLFVLGMNRDVFPRRVSEDPLLPDALRRVLEAVLPEVPRKQRGFEEERFLFAQLCAASPRVVLSWQSVSEDGRARTPSPFVERLLLAGREAEALPAVLSEPAPAPRLRPAFEHALLAGLHGQEEEREARYAAARDEARRELGAGDGVPAAILARARGAARREWEGEPGSRRLGPYLGLVGPPGAEDLRSRALFVTHLEGMARCPWRHFLEKLLGLEPVPDALGWLPGPDARLLGSAVHGAVEAIVRAGADLPEDEPLADALGREARTLVWPDAEAEALLVRGAVEAALREQGIALPGYASALAAPVAAAVRRARELLGPAPRVLAAEALGTAAIPDVLGETLALHFKVDLALAGSGAPVLGDLKTGGVVSEAAGEEGRRAHLVTKVRQGLLLQGMAYAHAAEGAVGRYLFLGASAGAESRVVEVRASDPELAGVFRSALEELVAARREGAFLPRLLDPSGRKSPDQCGYCEVRDACVQGDSSLRARVGRWSQEEDAAGAPSSDATLRALWRLGPSK